MRKAIGSLLSASLAMLCAAGWSAARTNEAPYYLFTSFRKNGEDGLHLLLSRDGLRWTALGGDRSYLAPSVGKERLMRDPSLARGPDGTYHLVWTTGWWEQTIGYASSKDLLNWSAPRALPVMQHEPAARNAWAPELFYDEATRRFLIFWATTIPGRFPAGDESGESRTNHRIYATMTRDFADFTPTRLFFDPGFNVIDATILKEGRHYVMIFKDERVNPLRKNLRLAFSDSAAGPYAEISEPFTRDWVEGPTSLRIDGAWIVYFDRYRDHRYGAVRSRDLRRWEDISDALEFPADHRHGTVLEIPPSIAARLIAAR